MPIRDVQLAVHQQNLGAIRRDADVVLIGDSLVQFWPAELAARALGARRLLNYGVGLDRTQHVLWRLQAPELQALHPKLVVLLVGTNNLSAGDDACPIAAGIEAVAEHIQDLWPRARLTVISVLPRGYDFAFRDADRTAINVALKTRATSGRRWSFLDADEGISCGSKAPCEYYLPDAVHLSHRGYEVLSELLKARAVRDR